MAFESSSKDDKPGTYLEYEPDEKPHMSKKLEYDHQATVKSVCSVYSIETIEDNNDKSKRDSVSWLELELKKEHSNETVSHRVGHSVHNCFERFSFKQTLFSTFPLTRVLSSNYSWRKVTRFFLSENVLIID